MRARALGLGLRALAKTVRTGADDNCHSVSNGWRSPARTAGAASRYGSGVMPNPSMGAANIAKLSLALSRANGSIDWRTPARENVYIFRRLELVRRIKA